MAMHTKTANRACGCKDIQPPSVPMEPEDIQPEPKCRRPEPEDRQPVTELVPDVPGPQRSSRVRRHTMHYGDPVENPEAIQDEDLYG